MEKVPAEKMRDLTLRSFLSEFRRLLCQGKGKREGHEVISGHKQGFEEDCAG